MYHITKHKAKIARVTCLYQVYIQNKSFAYIEVLIPCCKSMLTEIEL